jgi:hypothetical protein
MRMEAPDDKTLDGKDQHTRYIRVPQPSRLRAGPYPNTTLAGTQPRAQRGRKVARTRNALVRLCVFAGIGACLVGAVVGGSVPAQKAASAAAVTPKPDANLLQLMRGVMFPQSNVIFAGQMDVSTIPHDALPAMSPNPLTSVYGGWQAVENSSLALAESAKLLVVPGRTCANGKAVPVEDPAWVKYVGAMHDAALEAYKAAQAKSTDDMVNATAAVSDSCAACHNVYRSNRVSFAARCTAPPPPTP